MGWVGDAAQVVAAGGAAVAAVFAWKAARATGTSATAAEASAKAAQKTADATKDVAEEIRRASAAESRRFQALELRGVRDILFELNATRPIGDLGPMNRAVDRLERVIALVTPSLPAVEAVVGTHRAWGATDIKMPDVRTTIPAALAEVEAAIKALESGA